MRSCRPSKPGVPTPFGCRFRSPYLDPASTQSGEPPYSPDLYNALADAVAFARSIGLNVILCVQDEAQSGEANYTTDTMNNPAMPNADTISVWKQLAPLYKNDKGVLLELFNEPTGPNTTANWNTWYNAMQAVVNTIRGSVGATNVIVADGVSFAQTLQGAPLARRHPDHLRGPPLLPQHDRADPGQLDHQLPGLHLAGSRDRHRVGPADTVLLRHQLSRCRNQHGRLHAVEQHRARGLRI